ncbi:hypothetical protein Ddc_13030 [Ditylenchus destructor]|nr:hypothetical protein Ddc_13030 [Ditylenchus destructor]
MQCKKHLQGSKNQRILHNINVFFNPHKNSSPDDPRDLFQKLHYPKHLPLLERRRQGQELLVPFDEGIKPKNSISLTILCYNWLDFVIVCGVLASRLYFFAVYFLCVISQSDHDQIDELWAESVRTKPLAALRPRNLQQYIYT